MLKLELACWQLANYTQPLFEIAYAFRFLDNYHVVVAVILSYSHIGLQR